MKWHISKHHFPGRVPSAQRSENPSRSPRTPSAPPYPGGGKDCHRADSPVPLVVLERVEVGRSRSPLTTDNARETRAQRRRRDIGSTPVPSGTADIGLTPVLSGTADIGLTPVLSGSSVSDLVREVPEQIAPAVLSGAVMEDAAAQEMVASRASSAASGGAFYHRQVVRDTEGELTPMYLSDSESSTTVRDFEGIRSSFRKRKSNDSAGSASGKDEGKARQTSTSKRGRTPSTSHFVGLAKAQKELNALKKEEAQIELEKRVEEREHQVRSARAKAGYGVSFDPRYEDKPVSELERMVESDTDAIIEIAAKSSHMKGTLQKGIKDRAKSLKGIFSELIKRSVSEETQRLQATNNRLQAEIGQLNQQIAELRKGLEDLKAVKASAPVPAVESVTASAPSNMDTDAPSRGTLNAPTDIEAIITKVIAQERNFIRACFAGIEDRLLPEPRVRPPLVADKKAAPPSPVPGPSRRENSVPVSVPTLASTQDSMLPSATPANEGWSTVVKRGKNKTKTSATPCAAPAPSSSAPAGKSKAQAKKPNPGSGGQGAQRKKVRLSPPKSAAVVLTLTSEAVAKGATYQSVLVKARESVNPSELGIDKIKTRATQTGARIFEFPGANGAENARVFASKMTEAVSEAATVSVPIKLANLEIVRLDDSVCKAEVVDAVSKVGGCPPESIRAGEIRPGRRGVLAIRLQCPVAAAKIAVAKGTLQLGFSSGVIRALEERPLRCFKCFHLGHVRARCPVDVDRARLCHRCGQEGHNSGSCTNKIHCLVCAASGKSSGHIMGGKKCNPPAKKGKVQAPTQPAAYAAEAHEGEENGVMSE